jgi:hypothetical protein
MQSPASAATLLPGDEKGEPWFMEIEAITVIDA